MRRRSNGQGLASKFELFKKLPFLKARRKNSVRNVASSSFFFFFFRLPFSVKAEPRAFCASTVSCFSERISRGTRLSMSVSQKRKFFNVFLGSCVHRPRCRVGNLAFKYECPAETRGENSRSNFALPTTVVDEICFVHHLSSLRLIRLLFTQANVAV